MRSEYCIFYHRDGFKRTGYGLSVKVLATTKEIMQFYDRCVVMSRFGGNRTKNPLLMFQLVLRLLDKDDLLTRTKIYNHLSNMFISFPLLAFLVMQTERYLGVYYPFLHRTSVTRSRLMTLLAIPLVLATTVVMISTNEMVHDLISNGLNDFYDLHFSTVDVH